MDNILDSYPIHAMRCVEDTGVEARSARHFIDLNDSIDLTAWSVPLTSLRPEQGRHRHAESAGNVHRTAVGTEQHVTLGDERHQLPQIGAKPRRRRARRD